MRPFAQWLRAHSSRISPQRSPSHASRPGRAWARWRSSEAAPSPAPASPSPLPRGLPVSTLVGLVASALLGAGGGVLFQYWRKQSARPVPAGASEADVFLELARVLQGTNTAEVETVLESEKGHLLVQAVQDAFAAQGLPPVSAELTRWFIRALYGKQGDLTPQQAQELKAFLTSYSAKLKAESVIEVPQDMAAVVVDKRTNRVLPTPLLTGSYSIPGTAKAVTLPLESRDRALGIFVSRVATQIEVKVRFKPDPRRLPELFQHFGAKYEDEILPALSDTIANETILEFEHAMNPFSPEFRAKFSEKLTKECAEHGLLIEQVEIGSPPKKEKKSEAL